MRIRSGNLLFLKPRQSFIVYIFRNSQGQTALAETQSTYNLGTLIAFAKLIFAHNAHVGHSGCHTLRNIIIPQKKYLNRKIG